MGIFVERAKNKLNEHYSQNNKNKSAPSGGVFVQEAKQGIKTDWDSIKNEILSTPHDLQLNDGTNLGKVTFSALEAIRNNDLDNYSPVSDWEKETLGKYNEMFPRPAKTNNLTQGNTVEAGALHLSEQTRHGIKRGLKNVGNFFIDMFAMQMQQTKYDPTMKFAEAHGLVDNDFNVKYADVVDKQVKGIQEGIKRDTEKGIEEKIKIAEKYPDIGKISRTIGETVGGFAEITPSLALSFVAPDLGTFAFAANAYGNALSNSLMQGKDIHESRINAGISFSASLAASAVSGISGKAIDKALVSMGAKQLMNKTLDEILMTGIVLTKDKIFPEIMRGAATGLSFAAVNLALNTLRTDYNPTKKEIASTLAQAAIFGAINSAVRSIRMSAANKRALKVIIPM